MIGSLLTQANSLGVISLMRNQMVCCLRQVCGGYPDAMARCAQLLDERVDVDFVDINSGCPIDLICNKCGPCVLVSWKHLHLVKTRADPHYSCILVPGRPPVNDRTELSIHHIDEQRMFCRCAGSSLMLKPARMEKIVRSMSSILSCPLTIKVDALRSRLFRVHARLFCHGWPMSCQKACCKA